MVCTCEVQTRKVSANPWYLVNSGHCGFVTAALVSLLSVTAQANLLTNGDFETGDLSGWVFTADTGSEPAMAAEVVTSDGSSHFRVNPGHDGQAGEKGGYLSQSISLVGGTKYKITGEHAIRTLGAGTNVDGGTITTSINNRVIGTFDVDLIRGGTTLENSLTAEYFPGSNSNTVFESRFTRSFRNAIPSVDHLADNYEVMGPSDPAAQAISGKTIWALEEFGEQKFDTATGDRLIAFDSSDPAAVTVIGETGIANTQMSGLDFNKAGELYAYGEENHSDSPGLYRIDQRTGAATFLGHDASGLIDESISDISFDPTSNTMFGISGTSGNAKLYTLDLADGDATFYGDITGMPTNLLNVGLSTDSEGTHFVHDLVSDNMYMLDTQRNATALPMDIGYDSNESQGMLIDWSRDDEWLHAASRIRVGEEVERELYRVDDNGSEDLIAPIGLRSRQAITLQSTASSGKRSVAREDLLEPVPIAYKPGDIAVKPEARPAVAADVILTSVAGNGKRAAKVGEASNEFILTIENSSDPIGMDEELAILLQSIFMTGPNAEYFALPTFLPNEILGVGESLSFAVQFESPELGFKYATLGLMTDVQAHSGQVGRIYSFNIGVNVVPIPATVILLMLGLLSLGLQRKFTEPKGTAKLSH